MVKKRKSYKKTAPYKRKNQTTGKTRKSVSRRLENELKALFYTCSRSFSIKDISARLKNIHFSKKELLIIIQDLLNKKIVRKDGKKGYILSKRHNFVTGTLETNPKGFGFLTNTTGKASRPPFPPFTRDALITASRMGSGRQGDTVLAQIIKVRSDGRPEAQVVKILERSAKQLAGFLVKNSRGLHVIPEDPRFPITISVKEDSNVEAEDGDCVIVKLLGENLDTVNPPGKIIEVLGPADNIDVQMRLVIERYHLPHQFSRKVEQECLSFSENIDLSHDTDRVDLRHICFITIDGESAKDFDDAIAVEQTKTGYRLYVSIADVSHFVREGSTLDREAYDRGTSIYFPGRVIPMLPEILSNNLCSLVPDKDRLTFTAILDFDRQGNRKTKKFARSVICSKQRFTYTTVKKLVVDADPKACQEYKRFAQPLKLASELTKLLQKKREKRGSIHFVIPEPDIVLNTDGAIASINRAERNFAHEMIEEFMLAANEAVAETLTERKLQTLYRIHEHPALQKVEEFISFAETLNLHLPPYDDSSQWYNNALDEVKKSPREYVVNNLLLRTMQQARYDTKNSGHFGLAATDYCHFTSPIRRYPDLVVHRDLHYLLTEPAKKVLAKNTPKKSEMAAHLSTRERVAIKAERDMNDRLKLQFMKKHIGESFDGIISGVNNFAFFVELLDLFVSGSVALSKLTDDYYIFDATHHRLVGELGHKVYQIGNIIRVTLVDVDSQLGRIHFIPEYT